MKKWDNEDKERRKLLNNICEYPYQLMKSESHQVMQPYREKPIMDTYQTNYVQGQQPDIIIRKNRNSAMAMVPLKKRVFTAADGQQGLRNRVRNA